MATPEPEHQGHQVRHSRKDERGAGPLVVIGLFKLLKAALLLVFGLGLHYLLHRDVQEVVRHWVHAVRFDPDSPYMAAMLSKLAGVSDARLKLLTAITLAYAALFATEGVGLLLRRRWAEYLSVASTILLLPLELFELFHNPHAGNHVHRVLAKVVVLVANVAIVVYLILRLRRARREEAAAA